MITEEMIAGKSPEEIEQLLKDNCVRSEDQMVKRYFTEDELNQMRLDLTEESISRHEKQDELKEISSGLRAEIKMKTKNINQNLKNLKKKYVEEEEVVYLLDDQEANRMYYYNATGELISERKLLPSEKQSRILNISKTA